MSKVLEFSVVANYETRGSKIIEVVKSLGYSVLDIESVSTSCTEPAGLSFMETLRADRKIDCKIKVR